MASFVGRVTKKSFVMAKFIVSHLFELNNCLGSFDIFPCNEQRQQICHGKENNKNSFLTSVEFHLNTKNDEGYLKKTLVLRLILIKKNSHRIKSSFYASTLLSLLFKRPLDKPRMFCCCCWRRFEGTFDSSFFSNSHVFLRIFLC